MINRLMVEESSRRVKGVGKSLMHHLLSAAQRQGCRLATVETFQHQGPNYYPKLGFTKLWERPGWGAAGPFIHFARPIAAEEPFPTSAEFRFEPVEPTKEMDLWFRERFQAHHHKEIGVGSNSQYWALTATLPSEGEEGIVVGVVKGKSFFSGCLISEIFVSPAYRGRGIGKVLLKAAEEHARSTLGSSMILVDVFDDQNPEFFSKAGGSEWKEEFRLPGFVTHEGAPCSLIYMRKDFQ
jgi:GNAT superfamily N-acetyltransferase